MWCNNSNSGDSCDSGGDDDDDGGESYIFYTFLTFDTAVSCDSALTANEILTYFF